MFRDCGWSAWLIVLMTMFGVIAGGGALALVALRAPAGRSVAILALAIALATGGVGVLGTVSGNAAVDRALAGVDPSRAAELRAQGQAEAATCTTLGGGGATLPALMGAIALALSFVVKARDEGPPQPRHDWRG